MALLYYPIAICIKEIALKEVSYIASVHQSYFFTFSEKYIYMAILNSGLEPVHDAKIFHRKQNSIYSPATPTIPLKTGFQLQRAVFGQQPSYSIS
jgi:hypothetical protein